ncbi:MAG TPA: hypothetical protein VIH57_05370 [Bacteroidales bacterium]
MYKKIPQLLSYLFHPLLMPTLGVLIILNSGTYISLMPSEAKNIILLVVLSCTFVLPAAFIPLYFYGKLISSADVGQGQQRPIPLAITSSLFYLSFYLLRKMGVPDIIQNFIFASAIAVIINLLINIKWKISAHMIGIGGVIGLIVCLSFLQDANVILYLLISIMISGFVGFARLSLNAHTPGQVYIGLLTGFSVTVLTMCLL